jgi:AraC family transcriptional regulator
LVLRAGYKQVSSAKGAVDQSHAAINVLGSFVCEQFTVCLADYPAGLRQRWHSHEDPILTLLLAGYTREQVGSRDIIAAPLDVGSKPPGLRHTDHFWPRGVRALRVVLSSSVIADVKNLSQMVECWNWISNADALRPLMRTAAALREVKEQDGEVENNMYDALAALCQPTPNCNSNDAPSWLRHAQQHLETSYSSGVRLQQLAREAKVHPVYFARQFRRFFGSNVGSYVRSLQLRDASRLLASRQHSLAEIACQIGFSDQPHMTRMFAREFGITPRQFQSLVR